ncbi:type III secretion system chaperone [Halodesulfovibrio marinisediminis]|uniref:Tir chaperone protein (CesT) family protein n=1 Tax=Halodesulfovibrio marinisediminis DSM 17456 TaxID=1121457 RepID=A0A1N6FSM2_9BACT|nr:type III secretion system chaperone [Halodesulfovibrio marinisediminis]SIN98264.1 Tir chaperone protein (CesT) family protein [Halodesulfovibrio marinisediminis DSM 17456]
MKAKHTLHNILTKFASPFHPSQQDLSLTGYTHITINGETTIQVDFNEEKESVTIIAPIATNNPDFYADLLVLNAFRDQLAGARFILLRETNQIGLLTHFDLTNLTVQKLEQLFEEFFDVTQKWAKAFENKDTNQTEDSDTIPSQIYNDIFNRA